MVELAVHSGDIKQSPLALKILRGHRWPPFTQINFQGEGLRRSNLLNYHLTEAMLVPIENGKPSSHWHSHSLPVFICGEHLH